MRFPFDDPVTAGGAIKPQGSGELYGEIHKKNGRTDVPRRQPAAESPQPDRTAIYFIRAGLSPVKFPCQGCGKGGILKNSWIDYMMQ